MKFIDVIMASRRREQSQAVTERIAQYTLTYPRTVQAAPIKPPIRKDPRG